MRNGLATAAAATLSIATASSAFAQATSMQSFDNDYPTTVIADYVFACMKANGETRPALSC